MPSKPILCVGQIVADMVVRPVDHLPKPGHLALVENIQLVPGGCACNTAAVLAKLGAPVAIAGLVGKDALGEAIMQQVAHHGVDLQHVAWSDDAPTSAVIVVVASDGQRTFLYRQGCNEQLSKEMVPLERLDTFGFVHVGGAMKLLNLDFSGVLERAREAGCMTSLDTDFDPTGQWIKIIGPALPHLDYLMTNEDEGRFMTGLRDPYDIGCRLLDSGPKAVIVKQGANGSLLITADGARHFPAFHVEVLDTTCAGDSFAAGLLAGLSHGFSVAESMTLANAAGALCTTEISHCGVRSLADTRRFVSESALAG